MTRLPKDPENFYPGIEFDAPVALSGSAVGEGVSIKLARADHQHGLPEGTYTSALADGKILVGNAGGEAAAVTPSGDVTMTNAGVFAIGTGVIVNADVKSDAAIVGSKLAAKARKHFLKSRLFNVDNGNGTTLDDVIFRPSVAITILAARVVPTTENFGTVNAATVKIGTAVNGEQIVAAVGLTNDLAIGAAQALTLVSGAVAANTPICVRHTGIGATVAGEYYVEIEFTVDD